jgi:hypothetical protein
MKRLALVSLSLLVLALRAAAPTGDRLRVTGLTSPSFIITP